MKRLIRLLTVLLLTITLIGCSSNKKVDDEGPYPFEESLKVLAIGNSFSDDSVDELWKIATSWGIPDVTVGMVYRGGTSLEDHYRNIIIGESGTAYTYFKYQGVQRTSVPDITINYGLIDEDWDVIMIQQVSGLSGIYESFNSPEPYLQTIIDYINEHKTNEDAKIAWNMTWAYSQTSNHADYWRYERNQMTMYNAIVAAAKKLPNDFPEIEIILPVGTAIQNARPFIGDHNMTRDGYHLNHFTGRYVAAMMVFKQITGLDLSPIKHRPTGMEVATRELVKKAVEAAYENPYEVSEIK